MEEMGVYRLYDERTGRSFVGFSRYLTGTRKRLKFELKLNACSYKPLQQFYNACGGLCFEVLEPYCPAPGLSDEEIDAHLAALALKYREQLHAQPIQVQI